MPEENDLGGVTPTPDRPKQKQRRGSNRGENERFERAMQLTAAFKLERYVYVVCCSMAVILLIVHAALVIADKDPINDKTTHLGLLFGASGFITYSIARLLYMWNKLVDLLFSMGEKEEK